MSTNVKNNPNGVLAMLAAMDDNLTRRRAARGKRLKALQATGATQRTTAAPTRKASPKKAEPRASDERAPRARFGARILLVKNDRYIKGRSLDISDSGIFVATTAKIFNEHELVRVHIRPDGMNRTYKTIARVVRYSTEFGYPAGYGLRFILPTRKLLYK